MWRLASVALSLGVVLAILLLIVLSQLQGEALPLEVEALFQRYAANRGGGLVLEAAARAEHPEAFDASMADPVQMGEGPTRASPGLYSGEVIQAVGTSLAYPPEELWYLWLRDAGGGEVVASASGHEQLYGTRWALHRQTAAPSATLLARLGCRLPAGAD